MTFYRNAKGRPGSVLSTQTVHGYDLAGTFAIPLDPVALRPGRSYWVSVQVNMDFAEGGQWGWENTTSQLHRPALWKNPGGGYGFGCTDWGDLQTCLAGTAPGPDLMFELQGRRPRG